jgi:hypothetical protein
MLEDRDGGGARVWLLFPSDARAIVRTDSPETAPELSSVTHGA